MSATRWHLLWRALLALGVALLLSVYVETRAQHRAALPRGEILAAGKAGGNWLADIARRQAAIDRQAASLSEQQKNAPVAERIRLLRAITALEPQRAALRAEADRARAAEAVILAEWDRRNNRVALVYFPVLACFLSCLTLLLLTQRPAALPEGGPSRTASGRLHRVGTILSLFFEVPVGTALAGLTAYVLQAQYGSVWPELEPAMVIVLGTAVMLLACITGSVIAASLYGRWQLLGVAALMALAGLIAVDQMLGWHPADTSMQRVAGATAVMAVVWFVIFLASRRAPE